MATFYETVTEAVNDILEHGFDTQERLDMWMERIRTAALADLVPEHVLQETLARSLRGIYVKMVDQGGFAKYHPGVGRFTLERVKPQLHTTLQKAIMVSANLIKNNRVQAIEQTNRRFTAWVSSIPAGGTRAEDRAEVKAGIKKALKSLPFEERRVLIDQGHKLVASINDVIAKDGGALAVIWHSHYREQGYNFRKDHKERDGLCYAIRDNWAIEKGLMKVGPDGYYDEITQAAQEPFCRCYVQYIYAIRGLPLNMITQHGSDELARVRKELANG